MREYRGLLSGYAAAPDVEEQPTARARTAPKAPAVSDLSVEMRQLLERYTREHPDVAVQPVAYVTTGGPDAAPAAAGFADLPSEEDLVMLALTETVASADRVEARSQVLMLRRVEKQ
jgi:hypothetical protein